MFMKYFEGRVDHNSDTIRRLFKAEYDTYEMRKIILRFAVGAVLAIAGLAGRFPMIAQGTLMMAGCWLIVSRDFPSKCRADRTLENRKTALPTIVTRFYDDYMELDGEGHMKLPYDKVQHLVEEKGYYFLFFGKGSACMIDGKTLRPDAVDKFREFVAQRTGLEWRETTSWLNMSLMDLIRMAKRGVPER